jgi:DMSO/TMAO reductase YedYZ molybdopterin-dependent catalytic subunit
MVIGRHPHGGIVTWLWVALWIGGAAAEPLPDRVSGGVALRVSGAVQHPLRLTLPDLRAMPASEPSWELDGQSHRARGVDLLALLDRAGLKLNQTVKNHRLRFAVVATGGDGYQAVFSLGELMPSLGGKGAIAAYEQDGGPLAEREGPLELIAAGDKAPSRRIRGLAGLRVVDLDSTHAPKAPNHLGP